MSTDVLEGLAEAPRVAPYGSWKSPISAEMLVAKSVRFADLSIDGEDVYWSEMRPEEQGRVVIVRRAPDGTIADVLPPPFSARTTANEYGGGAFLAADGVIYFSNYADQRIWRMRPGEEPKPLTPEKKLRFADYVFDASHQRLIGVCEDHSVRDDEPPNRIVGIDLASGAVTPLVEGADFYSTPVVSPDGTQLAWVEWNHPNMPWDDTSLYTAPIYADGSLGPARHVAGGENESIFQPAWSPGGELYFVSDRSDWWNLYVDRDGRAAKVLAMEAEFGAPQWVFGTRTYGFLDDGRIVARYTQGGNWRLAVIQPEAHELRDMQLPYTVVNALAVSGEQVLATLSSPTEVEAVALVDPTGGSTTVLRRSSPMTADPDYTSLPEAIEFPTTGGMTAHAFYYPPANRDFRGPEGKLPPLIVMIHGGPTSATSGSFRPTTQYWTSRGFAVCDVNYGGSTGYGREYRNRLRDSWGIVDVDDATNAALYLAKQGKVDRDQLLIRGGSAGGYTTLAALAFRDVFRTGASLYGVSDLALLAQDTHKFESRYLDQLVGRYPEEKARYEARSPIHHLEKFTEPVILLQGLEDKVVPPNQAELVLASLKSRGIPVAYVPFAGEQHGFRRAENIIRAQEAELYFYGKILGFEPADAIEPVEIFNLPK
ncbi:MAG: prolyl oligopeptidase family serine peptidase [Pirellulales bacterium]